jgi:hypothetical protein
MLAVTGRGTLVDPDLPAGELRDTLVAAGLLPKAASERGEGDAMNWPELASDLNRLRHTNLRGGTAPLRRAPHREVCEAQFGTPTPIKRTSELSGRAARPSLTDAVLLLADLVGPKPEPPKKAAPTATKGGARPDSLARVSPAPASRDSAAKAKRPPSKPDSAAAPKRAPAKVESTKPAKSSAAKLESTKPAKSSAAKVDSTKPAKTTSSKADSTKKAKPSAAKTDSPTKVKPSPAKADSASKAKKPPVKADSCTKAKSSPAKPDTAAKPKRPPATAPAHAPSRPDTASS